MSLPPERVNIKRKRDTESVDVLFIQDSKRTKTEYVFRKVRARNAPLNPFQKFASSGPTGGGDDGTSSHPTAGGTSSRPQTPRERPTRDILKPRRFHLERPSSLSDSGFISKRGSSPLKGSAANQRQQKRLAVLVEKSAKRHDKQRRDQNEKPGRSKGLLDIVQRGRSVQQQLSLPPSPTKKTMLDTSKQQHLLKPRASAAELRWREEKWGPRGSASRSVSRGPTPTGFDARELKLAHDLDAWAREEESKKTNPDISMTSENPVSPRKRPLKFQPKSSAARVQSRPVDTVMNDDSSDEDTSDYEYDVYERIPIAEVEDVITSPIDTEAMDLEVSTSNPELQGKSVGILVIEDEDEDLWASYQDVEESDIEFHTDEEDENAEDYYGNDYPEDEMDSDDEHGHGAYGYRYAGSDDEEFGNGYDDDEDGGISDDEGFSSRKGLSHRDGLNEFASPVQNRSLHPY